MSQTDIGRLTQIWRYPVSSLGGERLEGAELSDDGIAGDRLWCAVDAAGEAAAPEKRRRWRTAPDLLARNPERLELRFTDGAWLPAFTEEARHRLDSHFGFPVQIRPIVAGGGPARPDPVRPRYARRPIHLLTTASLRALGRLLPESRIDPRRFRPNLVLENEKEGFPEQGWIGKEFTIGSARLKVIEPCTRCAFTVIAQQELGLDQAILPQIVAAADGAFGVLCSVVAPGAVRVGDVARRES